MRGEMMKRGEPLGPLVGKKGGKRERRFLWDTVMLLLFLCRSGRGDKCLIEDLCTEVLGELSGAGGYSRPEKDDKNIPKCLFTVNIPLTGAGGTHVNTVTALIERV